MWNRNLCYRLAAKLCLSNCQVVFYTKKDVMSSAGYGHKFSLIKLITNLLSVKIKTSMYVYGD